MPEAVNTWLAYAAVGPPVRAYTGLAQELSPAVLVRGHDEPEAARMAAFVLGSAGPFVVVPAPLVDVSEPGGARLTAATHRG